MPEDDFDIYGEDDGFTTKGQVVSLHSVKWHIVHVLIHPTIKSLEDYDESANQEMPDSTLR